MEDAVAGYLQELREAREMLDRRYDDIKSGPAWRLSTAKPS